MSASSHVSSLHFTYQALTASPQPHTRTPLADSKHRIAPMSIPHGSIDFFFLQKMTEGSTPTPLTIIPCCFVLFLPTETQRTISLHPDASTIQRHVPAGDSNVILADLGSGGTPYGTLGRSCVQRYAPSARFPPPPSGQSLHPFLGTGNFPLDAPLAPDASPADPGAWQILGERHPSERHQSERRPTVLHRGHPPGPAWVHLRILHPVLDRPGAPAARSMGRHRRQQLRSRLHGTRKSAASPRRSRLGFTTMRLVSSHLPLQLRDWKRPHGPLPGDWRIAAPDAEDDPVQIDWCEEIEGTSFSSAEPGPFSERGASQIQARPHPQRSPASPASSEDSMGRLASAPPRAREDVRATGLGPCGPNVFVSTQGSSDPASALREPAPVHRAEEAEAQGRRDPPGPVPRALKTSRARRTRKPATRQGATQRAEKIARQAAHQRPQLWARAAQRPNYQAQVRAIGHPASQSPPITTTTFVLFPGTADTLSVCELRAKAATSCFVSVVGKSCHCAVSHMS